MSIHFHNPHSIHFIIPLTLFSRALLQPMYVIMVFWLHSNGEVLSIVLRLAQLQLPSLGRNHIPVLPERIGSIVSHFN